MTRSVCGATPSLAVKKRAGMLLFLRGLLGGAPDLLWNSWRRHRGERAPQPHQLPPVSEVTRCGGDSDTAADTRDYSVTWQHLLRQDETIASDLKRILTKTPNKKADEVSDKAGTTYFNLTGDQFGAFYATMQKRASLSIKDASSPV